MDEHIKQEDLQFVGATAAVVVIRFKRSFLSPLKYFRESPYPPPLKKSGSCTICVPGKFSNIDATVEPTRMTQVVQCTALSSGPNLNITSVPARSSSPRPVSGGSAIDLQAQKETRSLYVANVGDVHVVLWYHLLLFLLTPQVAPAKLWF